MAETIGDESVVIPKFIGVNEISPFHGNVTIFAETPIRKKTQEIGEGQNVKIIHERTGTAMVEG
jgi:hypothetical protein